MVLNALPGWAKRNFNLSRLATAGMMATILALQPFTGTQSASAATGSVVINEILANPSDGVEWVELYNPTDNSVDISSWKVKDNGTFGTIPSNTTLASHGYYVVEYSGTKLVNGGETVTLEKQTGPDKTVDIKEYPALNTNESFGRSPDGSENWTTFTIAQTTKGSANYVPIALPLPDNEDPVTAELSEGKPGDNSFWNVPVEIAGTSTDNEGVDYVKLYFRNASSSDVWSLIDSVDNPDDDSPFNWSYDWTPDADGTYDIKAAAVDTSGNEESSAYAYEVTYDKTAPIAKITSPSQDDEVSGLVDIQGSVTDANPKQYKLVIKNELGDVVYEQETEHSDDIDEALLYSWDTEAEFDGVYTIHLIAVDKAGNQDGDETTDGDSADVTTVTVQNGGFGGSGDSEGDGELGGSPEESRANLAAAVSQLPVSHNLPETNIPESNGTSGGDNEDEGSVLADQIDSVNSDESESEENEYTGCASLFGACWYWWVTGVGVVGGAYALILYLRGRES
jgi:hypothetical protein